MIDVDLSPAVALRATLHDNPEPSGQEVYTMRMISAFLRRHTSLEIQQMEGWLYAAHREGDHLPGVMLRADMDAVSGKGGLTYHGCGHDGHCAGLCAAAMLCEGRTFGKNIFFLFQPAEETGVGARRCLDLLGKEQIDLVYGLHNLPGFPLGAVLTRAGTFACASRGLSLRFTGRQSHAAYPETGRNPGFVMARLVRELPAPNYTPGALCMTTLVHMRVGDRAFGVNAGEGELCLTLRAEKLASLDALQGNIVAQARALCADAGLKLEISIQDEFPDTVCKQEYVTAFNARAKEAGLNVMSLKVPMRWSEDFGWYLHERPGLFFGIGAGSDCPPLHTTGYDFDDQMIPVAAKALLCAIEG